MHVGHKLATSFSISRPDGTLCTLAEVAEEKDLGVILTSDLKAGRQYREAARKAMNVLQTIKRHFTRLDILIRNRQSQRNYFANFTS